MVSGAIGSRVRAVTIGWVVLRAHPIGTLSSSRDTASRTWLETSVISHVNIVGVPAGHVSQLTADP